MPDRFLGPVTLWGQVSGPATVTGPFDPPFPNPQVNGVAVATPDPDRYRLDVTLQDPVEGEWTVEWADGSRTTFTVALRRSGEGRTLAEAFLELAGRVGEVRLGTVESGSTTHLMDSDLSPGTAGLFLFRLTGPEAYRWRRVEEDGKGFASWSHPFALPLQPGDRYALVKLHPERGVQALEVAARALSRSTRVTVAARGLSFLGVEEGELVVQAPRGWQAVSEVWVRVPGEQPKRLIPLYWSMEPGRMVRIDPRGVRGLRTTDVVVDLYGFRDGAAPLDWWSSLDREAQTVVALAQYELSLGGSGSIVLDPEDRLRKAALMSQEQGMLYQLRRYRLPNNAKPVLP